MRPLSAVAILVVFSSSLLLAQTPQPSAQGHIVGTVVNDVGETVAKARLCWGTVTSQGSNSTGGPEADEHGQFDIEVPLETNRISAEKPESGYWNEGSLDKFGQVIKLSPLQPTAHVVLKLGARPAQLTLNVSARRSGEAVKRFDVQLIVLNDEPFFRTTQISDKTPIPIPPDKDVMLIVHSPGYKRWFYQDAANAGQPSLHLRSSDEQTINVELEPETPQN